MVCLIVGKVNLVQEFLLAPWITPDGIRRDRSILTASEIFQMFSGANLATWTEMLATHGDERDDGSFQRFGGELI